VFREFEDNLLIVHLAGTIHPDLQALGFDVGWYVMELTESAIPMSQDLTIGPDLADPGAFTFGGTVASGIDITDGKLTVVSEEEGGAGGGFTPLFDVTLTDPWEQTVSGAPPASHQSTDDTLGLSLSPQLVYAYKDTDGVPGPSEDDTPLGTMCDGETPRFLMWSGPPTNVAAAGFLQFAGLHAGWQLVEDTGGDWVEPVADAASLVLDTTCIDSIGR
jgi:hypothetical protein